MWECIGSPKSPEEFKGMWLHKPVGLPCMAVVCQVRGAGPGPKPGRTSVQVPGHCVRAGCEQVVAHTGSQAQSVC